MTQAPAPVPPPQAPVAPAVRTDLHAEPLPPRKRFTLAPNWLQVTLIVGLLGAAVFVALNERYLWSCLLAVAGLCFGASYVLRRMVGDDYDRA